MAFFGALLVVVGLGMFTLRRSWARVTKANLTSIGWKSLADKPARFWEVSCVVLSLGFVAAGIVVLVDQFFG